MSLLRRQLLSALPALFGLPGVRAAAALRLFGDEGYPPYSWRQQGVAQGLLVERLRGVERRLGERFDVELTGWRRALQLAEQGQGGLLGVSHNAARALWLDYSEPLLIDEVHLVSRRDRGLRVERLDELRGLHIGVGNGVSYGQAFEDALAAGVFAAERDWGALQRLRMVLAGRLDGAMLAGGATALALLLAQDPGLRAQRDALQLSAQPLIRDPLHLGLPKRWAATELLQRINAALRTAGDQPR